MGRSRDIASGYDATPCVPSDVTIFPLTRALHVGTAGNIRVRMASGAIVDFPNVPVGDFARQVDMVFATGTNAAGIVRIY